MDTTLVAPSILAADVLALGRELADAEAAGANWHHIDVMDGHYVPNLTFGPPLVKAVKKHLRLPLDVHIMVTNPDQVALDYVAAGADYLVFHVEMAMHPHRLAQAIRQAGGKAGLAINPGTSLELLRPLLGSVELINVMSVNPGFGGQSFIPQAVERVAAVYAMLKDAGLDRQVLIEVDGGIDARTGPLVASAGASVLVAGTYVYGTKDRRAAIASLKLARCKESP